MKFRLKITLCMLGLLSVLFGVGGGLLITLSFHDSLEREEASAYNAYQMVLGTLQIVNAASEQTDYADVSETLRQLSEQNEGSWSALRLYTASQTVYEHDAADLDRPDELPALGSCSMRHATTDGDGHLLALSGALEADDETLYLDMAFDVSSLFEARQAQLWAYQWVFLLMAALCAVLSYTLARVLTAPLVRLSEASRSIAAGQLSTRVRVRTEDEVGLVARDFNAMAEAMEENVSRLEEAAARQERFMGSFAHEAKTPLTSIIGYGDLIRGQVLNAEEQTQAADYIVSEGKRLENLSAKLLELLVLKREDVSLSAASPSALVQGLAARWEPLYRAQGIELSCECEEGWCMLEPDLVKSLLVNVWDNARKAMDGRSGSIRVRCEMLVDGCRLSVSDDGRGIPPDALEHLDEAFFRVDKSRARAQGGAGLGLSLCREIVDVHGGSLRFESKVGEGTTVIAELRGGAA